MKCMSSYITTLQSPFYTTFEIDRKTQPYCLDYMEVMT